MSGENKDRLLSEIGGHISDDPSKDLIEELADRISQKINISDVSTGDKPVLEALAEFEDLKLDEIDSKDAYETKFGYIRDYFGGLDAESTQELTPDNIRGYRTWRKYESLDREKPLSDTTLQDDMYLYREFIDYLIAGAWLHHRIVRQIEIPTVDRGNGEGVDQKKLDPELAQYALDYLRKYHYASVEHVAWELFCSGGPRKSDCESLDVVNINIQTGDICYKDIDGELKNDENSERTYTLPDIVVEAIDDYIENKRPKVVDDEGREPLLVAKDARISGSKLQTIGYQWSRPCKIGLDCPHDRQEKDCEAAQRNNWAYKCPSSRAPHHIRTGYITNARSRGVSATAIDARCDVSPEVQDIYYDLPDEEEQKARATAEFEQLDSDPNSGYQP